MAEKFTRIQIATGNINNKLKLDSLKEGELFWVTKDSGVLENSIWSDGELYIGSPDGKQSAPQLIAGSRISAALVYQGGITNQTTIVDDLFIHARIGDFWKFNSDPQFGEFKTAGFHKDDFLLITDAQVDTTNGKTVQGTVKYIRINNSFASVDLEAVTVDHDKYGYNTLSELLGGIENNKLQWGGDISSSSQRARLEAAGQIKNSTLWRAIDTGIPFITKDGISTSIKGDLWLYRNDVDKWYLFSRTTAVADSVPYSFDQIIVPTTLSETHIQNARILSSIKEAIDYLITGKAELDLNGKIPSSQIPTELFSDSIVFCGQWNPIIDSRGLIDRSWQNSWPKYGNDGKVVRNGSLFIVNTGTVHGTVKYIDPTDTKRIVEITTGDFIVRIGDSWEIIDNTDRLSSITFFVGAEKSGSINRVSEHADEKTGAVEISADGKIVIYKDGTRHVIHGMRLVDQNENADGRKNYLPKYTDGTNTLDNSLIESNNTTVTVHGELEIGERAITKPLKVHGNIEIGDIADMSPTFTFINKFNSFVSASNNLRSNINITLPAHSGVLATTDDVLAIGKDGTINKIPVFSKGINKDGAEITVVSDSLIGQSHGAVWGTLSNTDQMTYPDDIDLITQWYSASPASRNNIVIGADTIVGEGDIPSNLHITGVLSFGANGSHPVFFVNGRQIFKKSHTHLQRYERTDESGVSVHYWKEQEDPDSEIYVGIPSRSGVLLTSGSTIQGGEVRDKDDDNAEYISETMFGATTNWDIALEGTHEHSTFGNKVHQIYKPNQSLNTTDEVTFKKTTAETAELLNITTGNITVAEQKIAVRNKDGSQGIIAADLEGTADFAKKVEKLNHPITVRVVGDVKEATNGLSFDGSDDREIKIYNPNQSVNKGSSPEFKNLDIGFLTVSDMMIGYDFSQTKYSMRALPNNSGIDDTLLELWGVANPLRINCI